MKHVVSTPATLLSLVLITHSRSYTMLDSIVTNIDLVIVLIVLFLVAPLLIAAIIAYGQGDEQ